MRFSMNLTANASRLTASAHIFCLKHIACFALALVLFSAPALAAPVGQGDALTIGLVGGNTDFYNPLVLQERDLAALTHLVYEGLVVIDDDYRPAPGLAERWESSTSGETWTFTLKEGITFHDGTPLTAADVAATVTEILRLTTDEASPYRGVYSSLRYMVTSVKATAENTVEFHTRRNNYGFLFSMNFPVLPAGQVQAARPVGTGPYSVAGFVPQDYMLLTANENWWDGEPALKQVMTIFHQGSQELVGSYEYNRVDAIITRSLNAAQYRSGTNTLNISYRTRQLETLLLNNSSYELEDVRMRRAIRYGISVDAIASTAYMSMVARTDSVMPPGTWMYNDLTSSVRPDSRQAEALLNELGWTDTDNDGIRDKMINGEKKKLSLRFVVYEEPGESVRVNTANQIKSMLGGLGIECRVDSLGFSDALARLKAGTFDLALAAFNVDPVPDPGFLLISGNTGNYMRYKSDRMDKLFTDLRATLDRDAYQLKLLEIQALMVEDCPLISLYYRNGAIISRRMFSAARDLREPDVLRGLEKGPTPGR